MRVDHRLGLSPPALKAPPGACDAAIHIYDAQAPLGPNALGPGPSWATVEAYRKVQERLGLSRAVVVQPTAYGLDNRVTLTAVEQLGRTRSRAIVVIDSSIPDAELATLSEQGACGARFQMLGGGAVGWEELLPVANRIASFGWHIQLQMDGRRLHEREAILRDLPCSLVIDHVGKFLEPVQIDHPGFLGLLRLLDTGRCWLKLSGGYEVSRAAPPRYEDVGALAKAAALAAPERMVWGSNWPHVSALDDPPDDAMLLDTLLHWVGPELSDRVLVTNAAELYGFPDLSIAAERPSARS